MSTAQQADVAAATAQGPKRDQRQAELDKLLPPERTTGLIGSAADVQPSEMSKQLAAMSPTDAVARIGAIAKLSPEKASAVGDVFSGSLPKEKINSTLLNMTERFPDKESAPQWAKDLYEKLDKRRRK